MGKAADSSNDDIYIAVADGVGTLVLNRPSKRNAITEAMWHKMPALLEQLEADDAVRLVSVVGAGGHFGAGNDIAELPALHAEAHVAARFAQTMADGIARLASLKKPTVAVIRGQCYGASLALTLATDLRFAAEDAVFAITPAKLGALYLKSDMARLFEAVGRARSLEMIYTARPVGAPEAQSIGLINRAVPLAHFDETLVDLEKQIVTLSSFTMMTTKAMMRPSPEDPLAETDESLEWWLSAVRGRDFAEGVSAFLSRRPPRFV